MTIRRQPSDFIVQERLGEAFRGAMRQAWDVEARHAIYRLTKTSRTTPEVAGELARALGIKPGAVSYAGLKDKHAHTVQHLSAEFGQIASPPVSMDQPERQWQAELIGWSAAAIEAPGIDGNRFEITIRGLARETAIEMARRADVLSELGGNGDDRGPYMERIAARRYGEEIAPGSLLVMNYFGAQRFGSARHGKGFLAIHLIRGEFEEALKLAIATPARKDAGKTRAFTRMASGRWGDWKGLAQDLPKCPERFPIEALAKGADFRDAFAMLPYFLQAMYVEAYQSHLWNRTAHRLAAGLTGGAARCLRSDDEYGEMLFPTAVQVRGAGRAWEELDLPLLAPGTELREPWAGAVMETMREEGIEQASLRIPGLRRPFFGEAPRRLFVRAEGFVIGAPEEDELGSNPDRRKLKVFFNLPRGSYATVVLRALGQ